MKSTRSSRMVFGLGIIAFALSLGSGILLFRQELSRRQSAVEYESFQVMTVLLDMYDMGDSFDPSRWPAVSGFGVYAVTGAAEYRYGSAPESIDKGRVPDSFNASRLSLFSSSLVLVRQTGSMPPMMGPGMRRQGRMNQMAPGAPMDGASPGSAQSRRAFPDRKNRLVYLELDVSRSVGELRLVFLFAALMVLFFGSIMVLLAHYSRKVSSYRSREEEMSRLVQLGEAARTLAHEIKNPLGVISVQCATLSRTLPEDYRGNIGIIMEETRRLSSLADRIRDFLHNSTGNPVLCRANDFLEQCRTRYDGRILVSSSAPETLRVFIDPARMTQVLDNLVANALDATEAVAPALAGTNAVPSLPLVTLSESRDKAVFSVVDRGVGISPENRQRLFTLFFTTKSRGSGLGLALSRRFVEQAGGSLEYAEGSGGGSVFTVSLPKRREADEK